MYPSESSLEEKNINFTFVILSKKNTIYDRFKFVRSDILLPFVGDTKLLHSARLFDKNFHPLSPQLQTNSPPLSLSLFNPTKSLPISSNLMAGFLIYTTAGIFFLLISFLESLSTTLPIPRSLPILLASSLSLLSISNSIISSFLAAGPIGSPLPLSSLPVAALFLILSLSSLLPLPNSLINLLSLSSFTQQFLLFSLRNNKDPSGLENRYFDLLLVPIFICLASSLLAITRPQSPFPRIVRAAGLALQGTWFLQMAFSLFTGFVAHGCELNFRGGADFTVVCDGEGDMHRSRAVAGLQFDCHLALLVAAGVAVYGVLAGRSGGGIGVYGIVGKELRRMEHVSAAAAGFMLDSDDDEERDLVNVNVNGFGGDH